MAGGIFIKFFFFFYLFFVNCTFGVSILCNNIKISQVEKRKNAIEISFDREKCEINDKIQENKQKDKQIDSKKKETIDKPTDQDTNKDKKIFSFFSKKIDKKKTAKLDNTEIRFLQSNFNKTKYKISISLPIDYERSDKHYPVIYMLDGHYSFVISHGIARYLHDKGLEKFILVGIGYDDTGMHFQNEEERIEFYKLNRTRDYTPIKSTAGSNFVRYENLSGGGEDFKNFINQQLIPLIDNKYRTIKNDNTLAGHSYGGLFTIWNYITENKNFKNFIAISPSCWYENMWIIRLIKNTSKPYGGRIYFSVGGRETSTMIYCVKETLREFRKKEQSRQKIKFETIKDENHETLFSSSFIHAVNFIFGKK